MIRQSSTPPESARRPGRRLLLAGGLVLALAGGFVLGRVTAPEPAPPAAQGGQPRPLDRDRVALQWSAPPTSPAGPASAPQPPVPAPRDREERIARSVAYASRGPAQVLGARCRKHLAPGQPAEIVLDARYDARGRFIAYEVSQPDGASNDALLECLRSSGETLPDIEPPGREISVKVPLTVQ